MAANPAGGAEPFDETEPEPDWFGDTSPFHNDLQLAAALPRVLLADAECEPIVPEGGPASLDSPDAGVEEDAVAAEFELMPHRIQPLPPAAIPKPDEPKAAAWSVRASGVELLPLRMPGRTGWSLENSIRITRRAEELIQRLRQEAVATAFNAAARALRTED